MAKDYFIDAAMLRKRGACRRQLERFVSEFGNGPVLLTLENVERAIRADLDVTWPVRGPWINALFDKERHFRDLYEKTCDADWSNAKEVLALLRKAPAAWKKFDAIKAGD